MKNIKVMHVGNIQKERQELRMGKYTLSDVVCFIVGRKQRRECMRITTTSLRTISLFSPKISFCILWKFCLDHYVNYAAKIFINYQIISVMWSTKMIIFYHKYKYQI